MVQRRVRRYTSEEGREPVLSFSLELAAFEGTHFDEIDNCARQDAFEAKTERAEAHA